MPSLTTYTLLKQEHNARRGEFKTVHGTVQTPAFQNVATAGAIKGGLSAQDLKDIGAQVMLCNTYHLHLRPGDDVVRQMGGLHKFMHWDGPILTDSGGFQVFSRWMCVNCPAWKHAGIFYAIFCRPEGRLFCTLTTREVVTCRMKRISFRSMNERRANRERLPRRAVLHPVRPAAVNGRCGKLPITI